MGKPLAIPSVEGQFGPKMRALNTNGQRRFVIALCEQTHRDYSAAYRAAGYGAEEGVSLRNCASKMAHDERIQEALQEEAGRRLKALLPMALSRAEEILADPQHKDSAKIALGVLDRSGLGAVVQHQHIVGLADDTAMLARIKMLAERNGIPLENLLGASMAKTIEHEPVPVNFEDEDY